MNEFLAISPKGCFIKWKEQSEMKVEQLACHVNRTGQRRESENNLELRGQRKWPTECFSSLRGFLEIMRLQSIRFIYNVFFLIFKVK